jgi:hypothetical protein
VLRDVVGDERRHAPNRLDVLDRFAEVLFPHVLDVEGVVRLEDVLQGRPQPFRGGSPVGQRRQGFRQFRDGRDANLVPIEESLLQPGEGLVRGLGPRVLQATGVHQVLEQRAVRRRLAGLVMLFQQLVGGVDQGTAIGRRHGNLCLG